MQGESDQSQPQPAPPHHFVEAVSTTGDKLLLDTSVEATTKVFGFASGDRVRFMKSRMNGKHATIVGAANGMLWFTVGDSNEVQTTSCTCAAEYIRQYGWMKEE
jgi:hypothetical protein